VLVVELGGGGGGGPPLEGVMPGQSIKGKPFILSIGASMRLLEAVHPRGGGGEGRGGGLCCSRVR